MPHFTVTLDQRGAPVQVIFAATQARRNALVAAGLAIPPPIAATLILDTGASMTSIDKDVIAKLGLQPTGSTAILTPSTGPTPHQCATFDVDLVVATQGGGFKHVAALPVIEGDYSAQGHQGLIGRDVLAEWRVVYSGPDNAALVSF